LALAVSWNEVGPEGLDRASKGWLRQNACIRYSSSWNLTAFEEDYAIACN
jgi:hypothetical protein